MFIVWLEKSVNCYNPGIMLNDLKIGCALCGIAASMFLTGCGVSSSAVSGGGTGTQQTSEGPLAGNWFVGGALPGTVIPFEYMFSLTIDEVNSVVHTSGSFAVSCTGGGLSNPVPNISFGAAQVGTGGAFTLTAPSNPSASPPSIGMTVTSSATSSAGWSGSVALAQPIANCDFPSNFNFTAVKLPDLTGTYSGAVTDVHGDTGTMTLKLQQGATNSSSGQVDMRYVTGTVSLQGNFCATSGSIVSTSPGYADGILSTLPFAMNDGSTWMINMQDDNLSGTNVGFSASVTAVGTECASKQELIFGGSLTKQ